MAIAVAVVLILDLTPITRGTVRQFVKATAAALSTVVGPVVVNELAPRVVHLQILDPTTGGLMATAPNIAVPAAGDPITATWGSDVATHANQIIVLHKTSDEGKTSSSFGDIAELTFPVTSGKAYTIIMRFRYSVGGTNTGIAIALDHPGGSFGVIEVIRGNASPEGSTTEWVNVDDTATGTTTTDSATGNGRLITVDGVYACTSSGTAAFRYKRTGTSTTVTIMAGSGGLILTA